MLLNALGLKINRSNLSLFSSGKDLILVKISCPSMMAAESGTIDLSSQSIADKLNSKTESFKSE